MSPKAKKADAIETIAVEMKWLRVGILGTSPIILHRLSQKAQHELLYPSGRKSASDKKNFLKHDPLEEYRASAYTTSGDAEQTRLLARGAWFIEGVRSVALDIPGTSKQHVKRNTSVREESVPLFGIPKLFMAMVRSSDMNRTPDIRTRAIVERWACELTIGAVYPILSITKVGELLAAAGVMRGAGDWRVEKGGTFGRYEIVNGDDPRFVDLVKNAGRVAQDQALKDPQFYDVESEENFAWFENEKHVRREVKGTR